MKNHKKIILASSSPRRHKILEEMGLEFEVIPSDYDEVIEDFSFSYEKIEELAYNKAKAVLNLVNSSLLTSLNSASPQLNGFLCHFSLILGADTVVVLENKILGKPRDEEEAKSMLKQLSGKRHSVVTSICVIDSMTSSKKMLSTTSFVEFNELTDETIEDYINRFKPFDKAGSYGIQELPENFVKRIEGSFENIIGLCPLAVEEILLSD